MAATEVIRVRVEPELKEKAARLYERRGTSLSQAVRAFLAGEVSTAENAVSAFDAIMTSADEKLQAGGLREPMIDEIDEYIGRIRRERIDQALAS